jgi:hypothetical protein
MMRRALAMQAGGYLLLGLAFYEWLAIPDRAVWQLLLTAVTGAAILFAALWLIGNALTLPAPFSWRRMHKLAIWVFAAAAIVEIAMWLADLRLGVSFAASSLTLLLRRPVRPATMGSLFLGVLWIATVWLVLAMLPFAAAAASGGSVKLGQVVRHWRYWTASFIITVALLKLPALLVGWVPEPASLFMQTLSVVLRFTLAYALALGAWLALAFQARRFRSATNPSR